MKTNESPEKIYIHVIYKPCEITFSEVKEKGVSNVEYTRTDVFIEKAYSWLKNHYRDYMHNPTGERLEAFFGGDMCNDFENYMKEE